MVYSSKQNSLIKKIASLKDKKGRREHGLYITEGVKTVNEAVKSNQDILYIVGVEKRLLEIVSSSAEIITVTEEVFSYLSDETTPQGVLAVIKTPSFKVQAPMGNALILDGVSDPGNMGTIIRTAAAAGYKDVYLINCTDPYAPKAVRSSMSGIFFVNIYKGDYDEVFSALDGYAILAADMKGENLFEYTPPKNYAIAIGNEANGLSMEVKSKAFKTLSIPMSENSESLNAAVAASLMMYNLKF